MMDGKILDTTSQIYGGKQTESPVKNGRGNKRVKIDSAQTRSPVTGAPFRIPTSIEKPDKSHLPDLWSFKLGFGDRFIFRYKNIAYLSRAICYEVSKNGSIALHHHVFLVSLTTSIAATLKSKG